MEIRREHVQRNEPHSMLEFNAQLSGEYAHLCTVDSNLFYMGDISKAPEEGIILFFVMPEVRDLLRTCKTFSLVGLSTSVPSFNDECKQLFILMGITHNTGFPIAFALMSLNTERAYSALFQKIKILEPAWKPDALIYNIQSISLNLLKLIFPNAQIYSCWFNECQDVWNLVESLEITNACEMNQNVYSIVLMMMVIPFLPRSVIIDGFLTLNNYYNNHVRQFLNDNEQNRLCLLFQIHKIKMSYEIIETGILPMSGIVWGTNNAFNVSHQYLENKIGLDENPLPWKFLDELIVYANGVLEDYRRIINSVRVREPPIWQENQRILESATRLLLENQYTTFEFLNCVQHIVPNYCNTAPNILLRNTMSLIVEADVLLRSPTIQPPTSPLVQEPSSPEDTDEEEVNIELNDREPEDRQWFLPPLRRASRTELTFNPLVQEHCNICFYAEPVVIVMPCRHQGLCLSCLRTYLIMPPHEEMPYYRCVLCRSGVTEYLII